MLEQFLQFTKKDSLRAYIKSANKIARMHSEFPIHTYLGISYNTHEIINFKVYYSFFEKMPWSDVSKLFSSPFAIKNAYEKYEATKIHNGENMGLTFAFKTNKLDKNTFSFYVKDKTQKVPPPNFISLNAKEVHSVSNYFVCEESNGVFARKNYYVLLDKKNIDYILELFKFDNLKKEDVVAVEYVEFESKSKALLAIRNRAQTCSYVKENSNFELNEMNSYLDTNFNLMPCSPGKYYNADVQSLYYMTKNDKIYLHESDALMRLENPLFGV